MFTINTNNENQILDDKYLSFSSHIYSNTPSTVIETVGATSIHGLLVLNNVLSIGIDVDNDIGVMLYDGNTNTSPDSTSIVYAGGGYTIASPFEFKSGIVVGKHIYSMNTGNDFAPAFIPTNNNTQRICLLHLDGTKTYIGYYNGGNFTSAGVTTQDGDRLAIEITGATTLQNCKNFIYRYGGSYFFKNYFYKNLLNISYE